MKNIFLIMILLVCFLGSCHKERANHDGFSQTLYQPQYASGFKIRGDSLEQNSLITVHNPWQGADNVESSLLILTEGSVPEGFKGQVIKGKAERIVCMSSSHIAMLQELGALEKIVGVSGIPYISNPTLRTTSQTVVDVGYEGSMDYEALTAVQPDIVLLYGVNGASISESKLQELGIPYIYIGDYLEEEPLGKAEWVVALAEIIGVREQGKKIFGSIPERYEMLRRKVDSINEPMPKVMINTPFADAWFMPSVKSYMARLIKDAGGDYIYKKNTGNKSEPIDMEEALMLASQADVWINPGGISSIEEFRELFPKFKEVKSLQNNQVFDNDLRSSPGGGTDFYESGIMYPDLILRDLIKIFHPSIIEEDFVYYRQLR